MKRVFAFLCLAGGLAAQPCDLLIKGGHVIDPANGIDRVMDVAVTGDKIARVASAIDRAEARKVIDAGGLYVTPGLIDLHTHVYGYSGSIAPDDTALPAGTTTIVDAGGAGWRTFDEFKSKIIDRAATRVLVFLNIVGHGMLGPKYEDNVEDMDPARTAETIKQHRDPIVGIKTAHFGYPGWTALKRAVEAGRLSGTPVMVDDKIFTNTGRTSREKLLDVMRPGDLHTHMYNDRQLELIDRFEGKLQEYAIEARKRGVLFDLGHGSGSFLWPVATRAMAQGFPPDTISTDLHSSSIMIPESDMPNCISKMMLLGMALADGIRRSTVNPARAIGRYPELGTLGAGKVADIALFELRSGVFAFKDAWGKKMLGTKKLQCVSTIRAGKLVFESPRGGNTRSEEIYDLLLKNGHVIDPKNRHSGAFDIAIAGGKIVRVGKGLRAAQARTTVDLSGYYVTPGLIDSRAASLSAYNTLRYGVTTATGAGQDRSPVPQRISRLLSDGATMEQAIGRYTVEAAREIGRPELGALSEGSAADVAVLERGPSAVRCILTVRNGRVVWDSEGLSATDWAQAGPYSNFK